MSILLEKGELITDATEKYTIEVKFKNGQISSHQASEIHFHPKQGGIDIFEQAREIPFFPGREFEVSEIKIRINWND